MMMQVLGRAGVLLIFMAMLPQTVVAEGRETLGQARLFTNDLIGDGRDRWRSGAYSVGTVRGPEWTGRLPLRMGQIMEYRFRGETIAPANLTAPAIGDRLYAGVLSVGAHTYFGWNDYEVSAGADIMVMGERSGVRGLQEGIHDMFSLPSANVRNFQVENGVYLHGTFEIGREYDIGPARLRPFLELQAGVENLARVGFDLTFGDYGLGGLRLRDSTTGQRITAIDGGVDSGFSFLVGGDIAYVDSSRYLPSDMGYEVEDMRYRVRAGVNYAFGSSNVFYGLTHLSEEFVGQPSGQTVGSVSFGIEF
jgi:Outer membrane protein LpxR